MLSVPLYTDDITRPPFRTTHDATRIPWFSRFQENSELHLCWFVWNQGRQSISGRINTERKRQLFPASVYFLLLKGPILSRRLHKIAQIREKCKNPNKGKGMEAIHNGHVLICFEFKITLQLITKALVDVSSEYSWSLIANRNQVLSQLLGYVCTLKGLKISSVPFLFAWRWNLPSLGRLARYR